MSAAGSVGDTFGAGEEDEVEAADEVAPGQRQGGTTVRLERMLTRSLNLCFSSGLTTTSHPGPQEVMVFDGSAHACSTAQLGHWCSAHPTSS